MESTDKLTRKPSDGVHLLYLLDVPELTRLRGEGLSSDTHLGWQGE